MPFRSWCRHCVRGRGKEEACRSTDRGHEMAEVHMDFMFMGDEGSEKTLAMLVVKERSRGMVMSDGGTEEEQRGVAWEEGDGVHARGGVRSGACDDEE